MNMWKIFTLTAVALVLAEVPFLFISDSNVGEGAAECIAGRVARVRWRSLCGYGNLLKVDHESLQEE